MTKMIFLSGVNADESKGKMKKTLIFGMLVVLILTLALSGCGGTSSSPAAVTYSNGSLDIAGLNSQRHSRYGYRDISGFDQPHRLR